MQSASRGAVERPVSGNASVRQADPIQPIAARIPEIDIYIAARYNSGMDAKLPLSPQVFHILLALVDGARHGYGITQDVERETDGAIRLGPGTLYGALKRLVGAGWVEESDRRPDPELDDERRRYYRLTPTGRRILGADATRLVGALNRARRAGLLKPRTT